MSGNVCVSVSNMGKESVDEEAKYQRLGPTQFDDEWTKTLIGQGLS